MPSNGKKSATSPTDNSGDIHILVHVSTLICLQLNHYQYLFLLRLFEEVKELATYFGIDSSRITKVINSFLCNIAGILFFSPKSVKL